MKITHLDVDYFHTGGGVFTENGLTHTKSLPCLSVVQALEGWYGISLDGGREVTTGESGVFIAPSRVSQRIVHHVGGAGGTMRAHWLFLGVTVNRRFPLDEVCRFPLLMPAEYNEEVKRLVTGVHAAKDVPAALPLLYRVLELLLGVAATKPPKDEAVLRLTGYIRENYSRGLSAAEMSEIAGMPPATLFRRFKRAMGTSPGDYLCDMRLQYACILLETTDMKITEIAEAVGIGDPFYFSKRFRAKYAVSPSGYRRLR